MEREAADLTVPFKEILRYLGTRERDAGPLLFSQISQCLGRLRETASPRSLCQEFPVYRTGPDTLQIAGMRITSVDLSGCLTDCPSCYLLAATLGMGPDRLIRRSQAGRVSEGLIYQACAAAMIEAYLDQICRELADLRQREGEYLRPRFSPGYGDFSLEYQRDLSQILQLPKRLGISLTQSLMMLPTKSVTAVIGISRKEPVCVRSGCRTCTHTDCLFRREDPSGQDT